ncbi:MAG: hypothetical protein ACXAAK_03280 [Candidatus Thorarchaeota archaeon]|jgi:hypothetical protein
MATWKGVTSMKKMYLKAIAVSVLVVLLSAVPVGDIPKAVDIIEPTGVISRAIPSAIVWSDNFDDEDISDWQQFAVDPALPEPVLPGNSSAVGGVLRQVGNERAYAGHNSSVAFGSWEFDIDIQANLGDGEIIFPFISEAWNYDWPARESIGEAYVLVFYIEPSEHSVALKKTSHENGILELDSYTGSSLIGWKNIIITRESSGQFYVYMDGSLILGGKNLQHTTSERFYFVTYGGPAIDNVTVSSFPLPIDIAPPEWSQPITNQQIIAGDPFDYDLNATDYSGIDQWWINDTQNFAIDVNGVISNLAVLVVGTYGISVSVNDTLGNTQTGMFRLTVESPPPLFPIELIIGSVGAIALVIVALVIWRKRG